MRKPFRNRLALAWMAMGSMACLHQVVTAADSGRFDITSSGAIADGKTLNTKAIQSAIDTCVNAGGGTVVVPKGEFISGALFLKPGVNIELQEGAVLKASDKLEDFPVVPNVRFEGHFSDRVIALLNAEHTDHLRITGPGTLDGNGEAYWNAKTPNGRPRLVYIRDSADVAVNGVRFLNSASWNLHFYNCQNVTVDNSRFEIDDSAKGPSTDGVDVDGSQNVVVKNCFFSVNDDCVCIKGNRYDGLDQQPRTTPTSHVRVTGCTFRRGLGALTLGTEATIIRDIEMSDSTVTGNMPVLYVKMRPDTPGQDYQDVRVHDIKVDGPGKIVLFSLTHGTKIAPRPPRAIIKNITLSNITGSFGTFGRISNNPNTDISDIAFHNINVTLKKPELLAEGVTNVTLDNVIVNGNRFSATQPAEKTSN